MKRLLTSMLGVAFLACCIVPAHATTYPPGPGGLCTDTLTIMQIQNPAAACHPTPPDTVYGVKGIITGFDTFTNAGLYIQNSDGEPWAGIDVFTNNQNFAGLGFALGDSIAVYGRIEEFNGGTEIIAYDGSFGTDRVVRKISSGNALPPFKVGDVPYFDQLPTNPNAEQWEGCLVKIPGPLRVARNKVNSGSPSGYPFQWMILVDANNPTPAANESLLVDMATLANPALTPLAIGAVVDSIQGIYEQRQRGYMVQIRDAADLFAAAPPNLADAYPIEDNLIRVVFDRPVTEATAENILNYELSSLRDVDTATLVGGAGNIVLLEVSDPLADGAPEGLTVNSVVSTSGLPMTGPQTRNFFNGVMTVADLQAPDPAFLGACEDRSRFAGAGSTAGTRLSFRGVCTGILNGGQLFYMQDEAGGPRSGVPVYIPSTPLVPGHKYLIAAALQEFFNETEIVGSVYIVDEGLGTIPEPLVVTAANAADSTCDAAQALLTGEDYESVLIKIPYVRATENSPVVGGFFWTASPDPTYIDSIQVDNDGEYAYQADSLDVISVTGILRWSFGRFRINPRTDADILFHGNNVGVPSGTPASLSFAVWPNPARTPRITFGLPTRERVELDVFDLQGRKVVTLARGIHDAGTHSRTWDGLDASGQPVGSGVYFYRLKVGNQVHTLRGVHLE
jgi:hypothetical protein